MKKIYDRLIVILVVAISLVLITFGVGKFMPKAGLEETTEISVSSEEMKPVSLDDQEVEKDLTVDLDAAIIDDFSWANWGFLDSSMPKMGKERTEQTGLSDAVSFPFRGENDTERYRELQEEILRNPVFADMVARGLKGISLSTGKTVGELNPWLGEFISSTDAAMLVPAGEHPRGNEHWLERVGGEIHVTKNFRQYAALICVLLDRLRVRGVSSWTSEENYHLPFVAEGSITRTELSGYQEDRSALILAYVRKDGKEEFVIGFNIHDKRLERFKKPEPQPTAPRPTAPRPTAPRPTAPDPSRGSLTPTNGTEPPTTGHYDGGGGGGGGRSDRDKLPVQDPVNQGNAERGGGQNLSSDGAGKYQLSDPAMDPSTGSAEDNGHGHSDPKTVVPDTPEPEKTDPGRSGETVDNTSEVKLDYQPDNQSQGTGWTDVQSGNSVHYGEPSTQVSAGVSEKQNSDSTPALQGELTEPID